MTKTYTTAKNLEELEQCTLDRKILARVVMLTTNIHSDTHMSYGRRSPTYNLVGNTYFRFFDLAN